MQDRARVVVIGGGIHGAALLMGLVEQEQVTRERFEQLLGLGQKLLLHVVAHTEPSRPVGADESSMIARSSATSKGFWRKA